MQAANREERQIQIGRCPEHPEPFHNGSTTTSSGSKTCAVVSCACHGFPSARALNCGSACGARVIEADLNGLAAFDASRMTNSIQARLLRKRHAVDASEPCLTDAVLRLLHALLGSHFLAAQAFSVCSRVRDA